MKKLIVLICLLAGCIALFPLGLGAAILSHESFCIISGVGQAGDGTYSSEMIYNGSFGTDGYSFSGGAVGIQGSLSQTLFSRPPAKPVYGIPANAAFKFNVGPTVDSLNATYGAGNWTIANPTLRLQYTLYANHPKFGAGPGTFDIYWVANDTWYQNGSTLEANAIYASTPEALSTWSGGQSLLASETYLWTTPNYAGTYDDLTRMANGSIVWVTDKLGDRQSTVTYSLAADPLLANDVLSASAGANSFISLYLMATSDTLGMTVFTGGGSVLPTFSFDVVPAPSVAYIPLVSGWNFVSTPTQPRDTDIFAALNDISRNVNIVWAWEASSRTWLRYRPSGSNNTLTAFETGKGYWIYMNGAAQLTLSGMKGPKSTQLAEGWNLVGYNGTDGASVTTGLQGIAGKWSILWGWADNAWSVHHVTIPKGQIASIPALTGFNQGKAYWIKMKAGQTGNWVQ